MINSRRSSTDKSCLFNDTYMFWGCLNRSIIPYFLSKVVTRISSLGNGSSFIVCSRTCLPSIFTRRTKLWSSAFENRLASGSLGGLARGHELLPFPDVSLEDLEVDLVMDLRDEMIFCIQGESLNSFGIDGRQRTRNPAVISETHHNPKAETVYVTSGSCSN